MKRRLFPLLTLALMLALTVFADAAETRTEEVVRSLGGTAGQINVLLNDRCIDFTDAAPESRDGRTMVPLRAALEAMGAEVDYDRATGTVSVRGGRADFTHVIGTDVITMSDGAQRRMDVASYGTESGRTMVPVRFFSQVLGYDVYWDNDYRLVFLLDREALIREADGGFSILNDFLARSAQRFSAEKNVRRDVSFSGSVRALGGGTESVPFSGSVVTLTGRDGMTLRMEGELGALALLRTGGEALSEEALAQLSPFRLELLMGEGSFLRCPQLGSVSGGTFSPDTWYRLDAGLDLSALSRALYTDGCTVGSMLYGLMERGDANRFYGAYAQYRTLLDAMTRMYGDGNYTPYRGGYSWRFGLDELAELLNGMAGETLHTAQSLRARGLRMCSLDMTLLGSGGMDFGCTVSMDTADGETVRLDYRAEAFGRAQTRIKGSLRLGNAYEAVFSAEAAAHETMERIDAVPSGNVVDLPNFRRLFVG